MNMRRDIKNNLRYYQYQYYEKDEEYRYFILDDKYNIFDYALSHVAVNLNDGEYCFKNETPQTIKDINFDSETFFRALHLDHDKVAIVQQCRDIDPWEIDIQYHSQYDYDYVIVEVLGNRNYDSSFGMGIRDMQFRYPNKAEALKAEKKIKALNLPSLTVNIVPTWFD